MEVLLLHPAHTRSSFTEAHLLQEPVAALAVGPELRRRGHAVRLVDLRLARDLERELRGWRPDVAVVGTGPFVGGRLGRTLTELRRLCPDVRVLLYPEAEYGNAHVTERPRDYFSPLADALLVPYFMSALVTAIPEVVDCWAAGGDVLDVPGLWVQGAGGVWSETAPRPVRVGDYGVPDRTLLGRHRGRYTFSGLRDTAFVYTSFGCRYGCRYCPMSKWSGDIFERSVDDVVAELRGVEESTVFLSDYEPLQAPAHMARLADALEREGLHKRYYLMVRADTALEHVELLRRWRRIGLEWVFLGLDGHDRERLAEIRKGTTPDVNERAVRAMEGLGLNVTTGMVVDPGATLDDFAALRAYVRRLKPPAIGFTVETPLVGTKLHDDREDEVTTRDWSLYDLQHAVLPTRLPLARFYREMVRLHLFGARHGAPAMFRALSWSSKVRYASKALPRLIDLWFGARHHDKAPPPQPIVLGAGAR